MRTTDGASGGTSFGSAAEALRAGVTFADSPGSPAAADRKGAAPRQDSPA
jgi:hypothetical protein